MIIKNARVCRSVFSQALGLMFRKRQNLVMEFPCERRVSLHMFFVFFPIDVLILDKDKRIVEIKRNLKPFTFWKSNKKGKYVVEMGFKGSYNIKDKVEIKN